MSGRHHHLLVCHFVEFLPLPCKKRMTMIVLSKIYLHTVGILQRTLQISTIKALTWMITMYHLLRTFPLMRASSSQFWSSRRAELIDHHSLVKLEKEGHTFKNNLISFLVALPTLLLYFIFSLSHSWPRPFSPTRTMLLWLLEYQSWFGVNTFVS